MQSAKRILPQSTTEELEKALVGYYKRNIKSSHKHLINSRTAGKTNSVTSYDHQSIMPYLNLA